jgi:hypothetical protein
MTTATDKPARPRSPGAERQARYREAQRDQRAIVTVAVRVPESRRGDIHAVAAEMREGRR